MFRRPALILPVVAIVLFVAGVLFSDRTPRYQMAVAPLAFMPRSTAILPDRGVVAIAAPDGRLWLRSLDTGDETMAIGGLHPPPWSLIPSPCGSFLAAHHSSGILTVLDGPGFTDRWEVPGPCGTVAWLGRTGRFVTFIKDGLTLYDARTRVRILSVDLPESKSNLGLAATESTVYAVQRRDGDPILTAATVTVVRVAGDNLIPEPGQRIDYQSYIRGELATDSHLYFCSYNTFQRYDRADGTTVVVGKLERLESARLVLENEVPMAYAVAQNGEVLRFDLSAGSSRCIARVPYGLKQYLQHVTIAVGGPPTFPVAIVAADIQGEETLINPRLVVLTRDGPAGGQP